VELAGKAGQAEPGRAAAAVAQKIATDPQATAALDDVAERLEKAADRLERAGSSPRSHREMLLVILTWVILLGMPAAVSELPSTSQALVINEVAALGLTLAITDHIRRKKD
jgi:hypothetical protein